MNSIKLIIFFFLCWIQLNSQKSSIIGNVVNNEGKPEDFVIVTISNNEDSTIINFCSTDDNGNFVIEDIKQDITNITLTFSKLGFKIKSQALILQNNTAHDLKTVILQVEAYTLKEVVINDKAPSVIIKNDTTVFNTSRFSNGSEKKVEELLSKIPGITIDQQGKIKYQNKTIERVLIDGDDLLGADYTVGTKNISAKIVDKIEIIDDYLDNPLLKGILRSDKTVINLKIKDDFKNDISGTYDVGIGWKDPKYYANLSLIALFKKSKALYNINSNNIRSNTLGNIGFDFDAFTSFVKIPTSNANPQEILNTPQKHDIGIPEYFTTSGVQSLASVNQIFRIKDKTKVTLAFLGGQTFSDNREENEYKFFSFKDTVKFHDQITLKEKDTPAKIKLQTENISIEKGYSIRSLTSGFFRTQNINNDLTRNERNSINELYYNKPLGFSNYLEYSKRVKFGLFQIIANQSYVSIEETGTFYNPTYLESDSNFGKSTLVQNINTAFQNYSLLTKLMVRQKIHADIEFGFNYNLSNINAGVASDSITYNYYLNNINRNEDMYFSNFKLFKSYRDLNFSFSLSSSINQIKTKYQEPIKDNTFFLFSPEFVIKHHTSNRWSFNLRTGLKQSISNIQNMTLTPVLKDFQSIFYGISDILKSNNFKTELLIRKSEILKGYHLMASLQYEKNLGGFGFSSDFSDAYFKSTIFTPNQNKSLTAIVNGSYIIESLKSRVDLTLNRSIAQMLNVINSQTRDLLIKTDGINFKYGTAFSKYNLGIDTKIDLSKIKIGEGTYLKSTSINNEMFLDLIPIETIKVNLKMHLIKRYTLSANNTITAMSCNIKIKPKGKLNANQVEIDLFNPFNYKNYSFNSNSDYFFYSNTIKAQQRFFIITLSRSI